VEIAFASPSSRPTQCRGGGLAAWIYKGGNHILVAKKILKPLGNPSIKWPKSLSAAEVLRLGETSAWIDKATKAVIHYWWVRNHGEPTNHVQR
jgi:hypothetical protein